MPTKTVSAHTNPDRRIERLPRDLVVLEDITPSATAVRKYLRILRNSLSFRQRALLESIPELRSNGNHTHAQHTR